ncbi:MAG: DUF58 domain-containing protein [Acidimicrobiia bacterium]
MISPRGGSVLGAGIALVISWFALGEIELLAAGAALIVAVLLAVAVAIWNRPILEIHRQLNPTLVHEGDRTSVELSIVNLRRLPAFGLIVSDGVGDLGTARFSLGSLPGNEPALASYRIVCRPRGVYDVGPASVRVSDPLGLATVESSIGEVDELIVYPATESLSAYPFVRGRDPSQTASRPEQSHRGGEDFFTLRAYSDGDDLRRVHWPSSAKLDELMIRQMENPWQSRALIFLDIRRRSHPDRDVFEKAVRGAASVVKHLAGGGFAADLWLGSGLIDVGAYTAAMESLARVQMVEAVDIKSVAGRLRQTGRGGALVMVTGAADEDLLAVHRLLSAQHRVTVLLAASPEPNPYLVTFQKEGVKTVTTGPGEGWAPAWNQTMERTWLSASVG